MLIYDCEIKRAIPGGGTDDDTLDYCRGWDDFSGMGISVICAYDCRAGEFRVFMDDNFTAFQTAVDRATVVAGWNNQRFDDPLVRAWGINLPQRKSWDMKAAVMRGLGLNPACSHDHKGLSLDKMADLNLSGSGKRGSGANAPGLYQTKHYGELIDYCLRDVLLTKRLIRRAAQGVPLVAPGHRLCEVKIPKATG